MLQLRVYGLASTMDAVAAGLAEVAGAGHVTHTGAGNGSADAVVTADLQPGAADAALAAVGAVGVPAEDVALLRLDEVQQGPLRRETLVVWADLLGTAGRNARPVARYLVFMAVAGVIAAYGVIYANEIGVAISVTTIPASALLGVAAGVGELGKASGALLVLAVNVAMLVAGGTATLLAQRAIERRAPSGRRAPPR